MKLLRNADQYLCWLSVVFFFFSLSIISQSAWAVSANPDAYIERQPDGSEIQLRLRGDEHFSWTEDAKGYTVARHQGWYKYARLNGKGGLEATDLIVGQHDPAAHGLQRRTLPSAAVRALSAKRVSGNSGGGSSAAPEAEGVLPVGAIKNLVVMIRFSNHTGRTLPSVADVDVLFNAVGGDPSLAPTGSIRDVYLENSYGQMTLNSEVNPVVNDWIDVSNTEQYYANGNSGDSTLWQALEEALDVLDASINFNDYDTDNDGYIDSIAFIHSGYGAEWGGNDAYGTNYVDRIWSHRWAIQPAWISNEGVRVFSYHISPGVWGTSGSNIGRIGVIAHETGHFFGLPDLYDTDGNGSGIGSFGLMANSWGFNGSQYCPPHFSPWSKTALGWYTPTVIGGPGSYTLNQAEFNAEAYRIDSGYPSQEYLLIENRQPAGFDYCMPQGGLVIWHIDDSAGYNTQGYPGQAGWPENGNHYRVAVLQADGQYQLEKDTNRGDSGDVHHAAGVNAMAPGPGGHPNTDAYQGGTIIQTGHVISDISASGSSMTFCLNGCSGLPAPSSLTATAQSTSNILLGWNDNSSGEDGFNIERSADGSSWSAHASVGSDVTSFDDTGLNPASTWFYRVQAFDATDTSTWSNTSSDTTFDAPPAAPTGLAAAAVSDSEIDVTWIDNSNNETGYRVDRSDDGVGGWAEVASLGANSISFSDTGLSASTEYFYRAYAQNSGGDSALSNIGSATTDDPPPWVDQFSTGSTTQGGTVSGGHGNTHDDDGSVQSVTETESNGKPSKRRSSLQHRWTFNVSPGTGMTLTANAWISGPADVDDYIFAYSTDGSSYTDLFTVASTDDANVQMGALPASLSGTVFIQVVDSDSTQGERVLGQLSVDQLYIRTDNQPVTPPGAPTGLAANAVAHNQVDLIWTDNANDETGFVLERALGGSGNWNWSTNLGSNVTSYSDTNVSELTTYDYRVRAIKGATPSADSNIASATTPDAPVGTINLTANGYKIKGKHHVDLSWSGNSGNVDIYRDGNVVENGSNVGGSTFTDPIGAKGGASYDYEVCETGTAVCSLTQTVVF